MNTEFKGTQGEWRIINGGFSKKREIPNLIQIYATNDDLEMICKVNKDQLLHNKVQNHEANAQLIAAAPELLKELQKIKLDIEIGVIGVRKSSPIYQGIVRSINKALGNNN